MRTPVEDFHNRMSSDLMICCLPIMVCSAKLAVHSQNYSRCYDDNTGLFPYLGFINESCITWYHRLDSRNNRNVFSHKSGSWKSKIKLSKELVSPKASPLGSQTPAFSSGSPSVCVHTLGLSLFL